MQPEINIKIIPCNRNVCVKWPCQFHLSDTPQRVTLSLRVISARKTNDCTQVTCQLLARRKHFETRTSFSSIFFFSATKRPDQSARRCSFPSPAFEFCSQPGGCQSNPNRRAKRTSAFEFMRLVPYKLSKRIRIFSRTEVACIFWIKNRCVCVCFCNGLFGCVYRSLGMSVCLFVVANRALVAYLGTDRAHCL